MTCKPQGDICLLQASSSLRMMARSLQQLNWPGKVYLPPSSWNPNGKGGRSLKNGVGKSFEPAQSLNPIWNCSLLSLEQNLDDSPFPRLPTGLCCFATRTAEEGSCAHRGLP